MISSVSRKKQFAGKTVLTGFLLFSICLYIVCAAFSEIQGIGSGRIPYLSGRDMMLGVMLMAALCLLYYRKEKSVRICFTAVVLFEAVSCLYFHFISRIGQLPLKSFIWELTGSAISIGLYELTRRKI